MPFSSTPNYLQILNSVLIIRTQYIRFSLLVHTKTKFTNMATYTAEYIKEKLEKSLKANHVEVTDLSDGCGMKFAAVIVSDEFEGKPLLQRHRMVNGILEDELKIIHAFTQKTMTTQQWQQQK